MRPAGHRYVFVSYTLEIISAFGDLGHETFLKRSRDITGKPVKTRPVYIHDRVQTSARLELSCVRT